jgi:hypothetical protein
MPDDVVTPDEPEYAGTVHVFVDSVPEGDPVALPAFGTVPNGGSRQVTAGQIAEFKAQGFTWPDGDELSINISTKEPEVEEAPVGDQSETPVAGTEED